MQVGNYVQSRVACFFLGQRIAPHGVACVLCVVLQHTSKLRSDNSPEPNLSSRHVRCCPRPKEARYLTAPSKVSGLAIKLLTLEVEMGGGRVKFQKPLITSNVIIRYRPGAFCWKCGMYGCTVIWDGCSLPYLSGPGFVLDWHAIRPDLASYLAMYSSRFFSRL